MNRLPKITPNKWGRKIVYTMTKPGLSGRIYLSEEELNHLMSEGANAMEEVESLRGPSAPVEEWAHLTYEG